MIRQKTVQFDAPSTRAASSTSSGTDCRPADMMMNERPTNCQTAITATAGSAHVEFCSTDGWGLMPSHGSSPTTGFISE